MRGYFLLLFLLVSELMSFAQTSEIWIDYLKEIKSDFKVKDKICLKYDCNNGPSNQTSSLIKSSDCRILFKDLKDVNFCDSLTMFYYSYYLSDSNYATLTFLMTSPYILVLYNYSPEGDLLHRIEVYGDGESAMFDSTSSYFSSDTTFVVTKKLGAYERRRRKVIYKLSTSDCTYSINDSGKIVFKECKNIIKTQGVPKSYKIFIPD